MLRFWNFLVLLEFLVYSNSYASLIGTEKSWQMEIISIVYNSSDEKLLKIDIKIEPVGRGKYGVSGYVNVNADVEVGDSTMVEALVYRSATGSSEYKITPFTMKKLHLFDFFNSFYKDILMESLAKCSDLPTFKDKFQPPLEKKTYKLNHCMISNDGLPPYMNEGFYKIHVIGTGKVQYFVEILLKVEHDS